MWLTLLLLACNGNVDSEPLPYIYDDTSSDSPSLELDELEASVEAFFGTAFDVTALPVTRAYFDSADDQEAACPPLYSDGENDYWFGECTTQAGTAYSGYAFALTYDDAQDGDYTFNGAAVSGVFDITTPSGSTFTGGGDASWFDATYSGDDEPHTYSQSTVSGTFLWDSPDASGTWLSRNISPDIQLTAYYLTNFGAGVWQMSGGISGLGEPADTVVVDGLSLFDPALTACGIEPGGIVSVRSDDGAWFDIVFDNISELGENMLDPSKCDGCGGVYWRGEYLGDVCPNIDGLIGWEGRPW